MVETVAPDELAAALVGDGPLVVDTRSKAAYADGHVPGAVNYPFAVDDDLDPAAFREATGATEDDRIVTVCGGGKSSTALADALADAGLDAAVVDGGMRAWTNADGPVEQRMGEKQE